MTHIQSVLFDRRYWTKKDAINNILNSDVFYITKPPHVTKNYIRFRQITPNHRKYKYRTARLKSNIVLIFGFPK